MALRVPVWFVDPDSQTPRIEPDTWWLKEVQNDGFQQLSGWQRV